MHARERFPLRVFDVQDEDALLSRSYGTAQDHAEQPVGIAHDATQLIALKRRIVNPDRIR
jgi:hypothetical protein